MEKENKLLTHFDKPERKNPDEILKEQELFRNDELLKQLLESFPEMVYILNDDRQIIAWNSKSFFFHNDLDVTGKRFGEAINCIHSKVMEAGCGTSKFCAECGVAKGIKHTINLVQKSVEECRISSDINGVEASYDFLVETTPIYYKGKNYFVCALKDIADEKRRLALEGIFFHDILNTATALNTISYMLKETKDKDELEELSDAMIGSSEQLLQEIISQHELRNAEDKTLQVNIGTISVNEILKSVYNIYHRHNLAKNKILEMEELDPETKIETDKSLVIRSLGNLVKNALEATDQGGSVKISAVNKNDLIQFNVYNDKVIPDNVQHHIFQRSFSTKGSPGRGIGTYSVKLIIEQYLKGTVGFVSNEDVNTIFTISIPL